MNSEEKLYGKVAFEQAEKNKAKWEKVFSAYENYRHAQIRKNAKLSDILNFKKWLVLNYRPVKMYFKHK